MCSWELRAVCCKKQSVSRNFVAWALSAFAFSCWEIRRVWRDVDPTRGVGISSLGSGLRARASFHT